MIQNRRFALMMSTVYQIADTIHIIHQHSKVTVLRIMSMCIKMRWAVLIREILGRKSMRNKMIHTSNHKMIRQICLQSHPFFPAIISKNFAHGAIFFTTIYCCRAGSKTPQCEMIKHTVTRCPQMRDISNIFSLW